jgi:hypothetical protein
MDDGTPKCWGYLHFSIPQAAIGNVADISVGDAHLCLVLKSSATVTCIGSNLYGQLNVPAGLGSVVKVATGSTFSCALNNAGTSRCWGYLQGNFYSFGAFNNVTQITAGGIHVCETNNLGQVKCWGNDIEQEPSLIPTLTGPAVSLNANGDHVCVVDDSQKLICWSKNNYGQSDVPPDLGKVKQVSTGYADTCVITADSKARCWGYNHWGETDVPADLGEVTAISTGPSFSCATTVLQTVKCWGSSDAERQNIPADLQVPVYQKFATTPAATISGSPIVKETVYCNAGAWESGTTLAFQWLRDGLPIVGANSSYYQVAPEDFKSNLSVEVFATKPGHLAASSISQTIFVTTKYFERGIGAPTINYSEGIIYGPSQVQFGDATITYQWYELGQSQWYKDGLKIEGATSSQYSLKNSDLGHAFVLEMTQSQQDYVPIVAWSEPFTPSQLPPAPKILAVRSIDANGDLRVIFDPGPYTDRLSFPAAYSWSIDKGQTWINSANGNIPSLPFPNYYLDVNIGQTYTDVSILMRSMNSGGWGPPSPEFKANTGPAIFPLGTPTIEGVPRIGEILHAKNTWSNDATTLYQWLRNGSKIPGATSEYYIPAAEDLGTNLSVRFMSALDGWGPSATDSAEVRVAGLSKDTTLSMLRVNSHVVADGDTVDLDAYTTSVDVLATATDPNATVEITGETGLQTGDNTLTVTVTAADGTISQVYSIDLNVLVSSNTELNVFQVNGRDVQDGDTVSLDSSATSVDVTAVAADSNATVEISGDTDLSPGHNLLLVTVTAVDGSSKDYGVDLCVAQDNTSLSQLLVNGTDVQDGDTVTLDYGTSSVQVYAQPSDPYASYEIIGDTGLQDGDNTLTIRVTAADGVTTQDYNVYLTVAAGDDASLSSFQINGLDAFSGDTLDLDYGTTSVDVSAVPSDANASVEITGDSDLQSGDNQLTVTVTSPDGTTIQAYVVDLRVAAPVFEALQPVVSGDGMVGAMLTVDSGDWGADASYTYQWLRDGQPIAGQTTDSYVPALYDYQHTISVQVTGVAEGFDPLTVTSDPVAVVMGSLDDIVAGNTCDNAEFDSSSWMTTSGATPSITGSLYAAKTLSSKTGVWGKGLKFCRLWVENGQVVNNLSSGSRYHTSSSDIGQVLQLVVVATDRKGKSTFRFSDIVVIKPLVFVKAQKPVITGNLKAGGILKAKYSSWTSAVAYSYQWLSDGNPIIGATENSYRLTAKPTTALSIQVCGHKENYKDLCLTSDPTQVN